LEAGSADELHRCKFVSHGILIGCTFRQKKNGVAHWPFRFHKIHSRHANRNARAVADRAKRENNPDHGASVSPQDNCTNNQIEVTCQMLTLNYEFLSRHAGVLVRLGRDSAFSRLTITKPVAGIGQNDSPNWSIWISGISCSAVLLMAAIVFTALSPSPAELCLPSNPNLEVWVAGDSLGIG